MKFTRTALALALILLADARRLQGGNTSPAGPPTDGIPGNEDPFSSGPIIGQDGMPPNDVPMGGPPNDVPNGPPKDVPNGPPSDAPRGPPAEVLERLQGGRGAHIRDEYIVELIDDIDAVQLVGIANALVKSNGASSVMNVYQGNALNGFSVKLPFAALRRLENDPNVKAIHNNTILEVSQVQALLTQVNAPWGLDRVDQESLPTDGTFRYEFTGQGVPIYVVDSGILASHAEFGGRATCEADFTSTTNCEDFTGHGTHVAGIAAGTTYGAAKQAQIRAIKVCETSSCAGDAIVAGLDYVAGISGPRIVNFSLRGGKSSLLDNLAGRLLSKGALLVVAAGNDNEDACQSSPNGSTVMTVGSTNNNDSRSSFSNFGSCVDIFAPGSSIVSAGTSSNTASATMSGTSMAAPLVAGIAAQYVEANFSIPVIPSLLLSSATSGQLSNIGAGSANLLVRVQTSQVLETVPTPAPIDLPATEPPTSTDDEEKEGPSGDGNDADASCPTNKISKACRNSNACCRGHVCEYAAEGDKFGVCRAPAAPSNFASTSVGDDETSFAVSFSTNGPMIMTMCMCGWLAMTALVG